MTRPAGYNWSGFLRVMILGLWIIGFLWLLNGARYQTFLQTRLWPLFVGADVLLLLFFTAAYLRLGRPANHGAGIWARGGQAALLALPLVYMFTSASSGGLGGSAFRQRSVTGEAGSMFNSRSEKKPVEYSADHVNDVTLIQVVNDVDQLKGKRVSLIGRVYHDETLPPDQFILYRFIIICCAADAIPIGVPIQHADAATWPADKWLRAEGVITVQTLDGESTPCVVADKIEPIEPPANPYLSPF